MQEEPFHAALLRPVGLAVEGGGLGPPAENARVRRRIRKSTSPPAAVVSDTRRVVVGRAVLGAVVLAGASALADRQVLGAVDPADVLFGATLGLLAGPLALGERAARLGRPWAALVWCAGLAVVGVLAAAVQAGFAARVLATGTAHGVHAATYADGWLAALDPSTLRVVVARALPLALLPAIAGAWGVAGRVLGLLFGGLLLPLAAMTAWGLEEASPAVLLAGHGAAWALPTGARASLSTAADLATWLPGVGVIQRPAEVAWLLPLVLRTTALDALGLALTVLLGDLLARRSRLETADQRRRRRWLPLARALPSLAVVALAALAALRDRPPPPALVGTLFDHVDEPLRRDMARALLARLGPDDAGAVPVLAAKLVDPASEERRAHAARLLARIGPPAATAALPELGRALDDLVFEVRLEVVRALEALGDHARPLAPDVYRALLAHVGSPRQRFALDALGPRERLETRLRALLDRWGYAPSDEDVAAYLAETNQDVLTGALVLLLGRGALRAQHAPLLYDVARRGVAVEQVMDALAGLGPAAVAILRDRLAAPDLGRDDPILVLLERELPPGSDDVLALAARHPRAEVRERAARALDAGRPNGRVEGAVELLVALISDRDRRAREAAGRSVRSHETAAALPLAREVDGRGPGALAAAEALGELGVHGAAAVPALARALADGEQALRLAAARSLGRVAGGLAPREGRDAALGALMTAVQHTDEQVAAQALEALRAFVGGDADAEVRDALVAALDAPSSTIRARAAMSLVHGGGATRTRGSPVLRTVEDNLLKIVPALVGGVSAPALRADALQALSSLGGRARDALPAICALVRPGGDVGDVLRAIAAIGLDQPGSLQAVARTLRFAQLDDRLLALGLIRSQGAAAATVVDELAAALLDAAPEVRRDAALALGALDLPTLTRIRPALDARAAREDDAQTTALLLNLLRRIDDRVR